MKVLGTLLVLWGVGMIFSALLNYSIWYSGVEPSFSEERGHGFFIFMLAVGIAATVGGVKLFKRKRT